MSLKLPSLTLLICILIATGCGSTAYTPYPYTKWQTPLPPQGGTCINVSGVYDLAKSEKASGPSGNIDTSSIVQSYVVSMLLGKEALQGKELKPENVVHADTLKIQQEGCSSIKFVLSSGKSQVGTRDFPVKAEKDNSGSGTLIGEFDVFVSYGGILGKDHAPFLLFLLPGNDLLIRAGYEKVGTSLLLPIIPRVHHQFEWYRIPKR